MTEVEPFLEYRWTREKARNSPEEWDELKAKIRSEGLKEPLVMEIGANSIAKLGEGNHRFTILAEIAKEHGVYHKAKIPVRFVFKTEVHKNKI